MADAAPPPPDALGLLSAALQARDAAVQELNFRQLLALFESQPGNLVPLFPSLLPMLDGANDLLKRFLVEVIDMTFCRPTIGPQARSQLAYQMPEAVLSLLNDGNPKYVKVAITAFASIYQPLFRLVCTDRTQARLWPAMQAIKQAIVHLFDASTSNAVKLAAIKAFQRIILVQSRASDARGSVASRSSADVNIAHVPADHPTLRVAPLEQEANERLKQIVTIIFVSSNPDLVMASMNCMAALAKMRASLSTIVFEALISWTPSAFASQSFLTVRSVEKTLLLLFQHFHPSRNSLAGPYASQIIEAVDNQKLRMVTAAREEEVRKEQEARTKRTAAVALGGAGSAPTTKKKRVRFVELDAEDSEMSTSGPSSSNQQQQHQHQPMPLDQSAVLSALQSGSASVQQYQGDPMMIADPSSTATNPMATFDATTLPVPLVVELIMANLGAIAEHDLGRAIALARSRVNGEAHPSAVSHSSVKREEGEDDELGEQVAQDPLKVDMGEEETLAAAEQQLQESSAIDGQQTADVSVTSFTLQPPAQLDADECKALVSASVNRICEGGIRDVQTSTEEDEKASTPESVRKQHAQLWTVLVTRLATRGFGQFETDTVRADGDEQAVTLHTQSDSVRQLMLDFVVGDFANRREFALQWMAEEFHCRLLLRKRGHVEEDAQTSYSVWLQRITTDVIATMDSKDKSLHDFLTKVPMLTNGIIGAIEALCLDKAKMAAGFTMLRDLAVHRSTARTVICAILLRLARNAEKQFRGAAIITVRNWVRVNGIGLCPAGETLENAVLASAKEGLQRLTVRDAAGTNGTTQGEEANGSDSKINGDESANQEGATEQSGSETADVEEVEEQSALDKPDAEIRLDNDVVRLVELPFALCVRVPEMLDEVFEAYARMPDQVRASVEKHITPLIQNLGANNAKLLHLIQHHPEGTDALAVRVFNILGERNRSKKLVDIAKQMAEERTNEIDPRFLIPILPDLEKAEIIKYLPRVVSILSSEKVEDRSMLKNVFTSVVQPPEQGFGSVSSNLPRVRQSELLSPVELMSLLHHAEKEIGVKTAAAAIRICFSMTDIFRSEVIGAVLNLLIDEPQLPDLFMRTAIIAVRTYKSLSSYISTVFLSRLITRKVWQQPVLWTGFKICAKQTAPASFAALIMLPRDQLRNVVSDHPDLRTGLRDYLVKKAGGNKARLNSFLELLGEGEEEGGGNTPGSATSTPLHNNV